MPGAQMRLEEVASRMAIVFFPFQVTKCSVRWVRHSFVCFFGGGMSKGGGRGGGEEMAGDESKERELDN